MALPKPVWAVLVGARKWAAAYGMLGKLLDSRSSKPENVEKAKKALAQAAGELFKAVQEFEKFLRKPPAKKSNLDWGAVFGFVAKTAGMLEEVAAKGAPRINHSVIDTDGENIP